MPLKNILIHVESSASSTAQLKAALQFSKFEKAASVTGICIRPPLPFEQGELGHIPQEVIETYNKTLDDDLFPAAEKRFNDAAENAGMASKAKWETAVGDAAEALEQRGRYADLLVVAQTNQEDSTNSYNQLVDTIVMMAGRPVLVLPAKGTNKTIGKKVLIAWDGSREAGRAVSDSLDVLMQADEVYIFSAASTKKKADDRLQKLENYLKHHDVQPTGLMGITGVSDPADALLAHAGHVGADTIIMGAYGHSRFREMVLGGATRHILSHATIPVLMAH